MLLHGTFLWRGFGHDWLRTVLGFRVANRISQFKSYISEESFEAPENWKGTAVFTMGQASGVDANFMYPKGYFGAIYSPDLHIKHDKKELVWTDSSEGPDEFPYAISQQSEEIEIDLAEMGASNANQYVIALSGISLQTMCDCNKQPDGKECNSDGMWPYHFEVKLSQCSREGNLLKCRLDVYIARAWTPNYGGAPDFAPQCLKDILKKPYNDRLDFELKVQYTLIAGTDNALSVTHVSGEPQKGEGHNIEPSISSVRLQGIGGGAYATAASVVTGFSFELFQTIFDKEKYQRLGRYIGEWGFHTHDSSYESQTGELEVECSQNLWVPYTTLKTGVSYRTDLALLQLGDGAEVVNTSHKECQICNNSSPNAPRITKWQKCGTDNYPCEQSEDRIEISTDISSSN
ncbi:MAG: hypothetical protein F6K14_07760 [Symploca sp. SIO2C1]|nr:hypothetical protein [Symploca sp. SIO2C1]